MPSKGLGGVHPGLGPPAHRRLGKAAPLPTWLGDQKEVMVRLSSPSNRPAGRVGPRQASCVYICIADELEVAAARGG